MLIATQANKPGAASPPSMMAGGIAAAAKAHAAQVGQFEGECLYFDLGGVQFY